MGCGVGRWRHSKLHGGHTRHRQGGGAVEGTGGGTVEGPNLTPPLRGRNPRHQVEWQVGAGGENVVVWGAGNQGGGWQCGRGGNPVKQVPRPMLQAVGHPEGQEEHRHGTSLPPPIINISEISS